MKLEPEIKQLLANFFHSGNIGQKKKEYLNSITFTANGQYEMRHPTHGRLVFDMFNITLYCDKFKAILARKKKGIESEIQKCPHLKEELEKQFVINFIKKNII